MSLRGTFWTAALMAGAVAGFLAAGCEAETRTYDNTGGAGAGGEPAGTGGAPSGPGGMGGTGGVGGTGGAGGGGGNCAEPLEATIYTIANPECGALPLGTEADAVPFVLFGGNAMYTGGVILPGQYELVKVEVSYAEAPSKTLRVLVFDAAGHATSNLKDFDIPALDGADLQIWGQGTYVTDGSTLMTTYSVCASSHQPAMSLASYTAYTEGCDDFLAIGTADNRQTLKRRRTP
ncbi:hypothetical protein [Polyangium jinanense]|uniref:Uncharacterized protein n=1 Tax=Polyangium jinanense TaxID=2829994 RepID=A0A9X3XGB2_9BACT|nr:hypothetical protein [Polyangium jinanense]MDC3962769.1 hypothetical protein [Polyangium jinanense]MDC3989502.1 hypothetical protein [Polyangium jinanense]